MISYSSRPLPYISYAVVHLPLPIFSIIPHFSLNFNAFQHNTTCDFGIYLLFFRRFQGVVYFQFFCDLGIVFYCRFITTIRTLPEPESFGEWICDHILSHSLFRSGLLSTNGKNSGNGSKFFSFLSGDVKAGCSDHLSRVKKVSEINDFRDFFFVLCLTQHRA